VGATCRFPKPLFLDYLYFIHDSEETPILQVVCLFEPYNFTSLTFATRPYPRELFIGHDINFLELKKVLTHLFKKELFLESMIKIGF
jgi:hypothetical protein